MNTFCVQLEFEGKRKYILFVFIFKFCPLCQAIAMVFKDMVKERNFISTCAFVPILLYVLCQCIYVLKFEIKYV